MHHGGLDLSAWYGEKVCATMDGVVTRTGNSPNAGLFVEMLHGFGYATRYAHLNKIVVRPGQQLKRNALIGIVGNTGKSTGPHLHYEVRFEGKLVDPAPLIIDLEKAMYEGSASRGRSRS